MDSRTLVILFLSLKPRHGGNVVVVVVVVVKSDRKHLAPKGNHKNTRHLNIMADQTATWGSIMAIKADKFTIHFGPDTEIPPRYSQILHFQHLHHLILKHFQRIYELQKLAVRTTV